MLAPAAASAAEGAMATWLSPQPGQIVSGGRVEIAIGYNTQSNLKVSSLELYADGQFVLRKILRAPESRGVCSFYWDTARVEQGSHNIVVKVFAGDQMISKVYGTATVGPNGSSRGLVDVKPPVVTFANIKAGDVLKGKATVKLNAADDSGQSPMVSLLVDDVLKLLKNTPPYQYDLDTTTYSDGDHALKTYAYDAAGNRSDPAVIKVAFRNGAERPVITTMNVNREVAPDADSASISQVPPSIGVGAHSSIRESGRTASRIESSHAIAPVVAEAPVKANSAVATPKPKLVAMAPVPQAAVKHSLPAPKLESRLRTASVTASAELRSTHASPRPDTRMAAAVPDVRIATPTTKLAPAHTSLLNAPRQSGAVRMAMASQSSATRVTRHASTANGAVSSAPSIVDEPISSSVRNAAVKHLSSGIRTAKLESGKASGAVSAAPVSVAPPVISKATLKQVRVAMAPDVHGALGRTAPAPAIACPPALSKDTRAKLEKKLVVPAKGKVKVRSFFESLGGVLFWDPHTHIVTACVNDMILEMRIGSNIAKVNGHEMQMQSAPYIAGDRTVFEAASFTQACALMNSLRTVGKAEVH